MGKQQIYHLQTRIDSSYVYKEQEWSKNICMYQRYSFDNCLDHYYRNHQVCKNKERREGEKKKVRACVLLLNTYDFERYVAIGPFLEMTKLRLPVAKVSCLFCHNQLKIKVQISNQSCLTMRIIHFLGVPAWQSIPIFSQLLSYSGQPGPGPGPYAFPTLKLCTLFPASRMNLTQQNLFPPRGLS